MSNSVLVQNELLAFAFDSLNADHRDCTEQTIDKFYDDSAVKDAKKLIWHEYVNSLPQCQNRRDTSTSAKTKDIGDIMSDVSTIDQKFSDKDELPVTFAAVKLSNVPSKQIREEPNILNRLQTLEVQMKDVIADRKSYAAATRAHINDMTPATGAAPKSDGGLPNGAAANTTVVYDPAMQPQQQQPNGVDGANGANGIGDIDGPLQRPPQNHRYRRPKDASGIGVKTNYTSEDGVITVPKKNRRRERAVFGNGADDIITSGLRRQELFVFQVNKDTTDDQLQNYISKRSIHVVSVRQIAVSDSASNSYHVIVHCKDPLTKLGPAFWPSGVDCRRYIKRREDRPRNGLFNE